MPFLLPIDAADPDYTFSTTLDGQQVIFGVRWNGRDGAWYLSCYDSDETPIFEGVRIVLGSFLGRRATYKFRLPGRIVAVDLSNSGKEASIDDLGTRVVLYYYADGEL